VSLFAVRFYIQRNREFMSGRSNTGADLPGEARLLRRAHHPNLLTAHFDFSVVWGKLRTVRWSPTTAELAGCLWSVGNTETDHYHSLLARTDRLLPVIEHLFGPDVKLADGQVIMCTVTLEGL
jgi:hypothetical protein